MFGIAEDERFSARIDDEVQVFQNQNADQNAISIGFDDRPKCTLPARNFQRTQSRSDDL
jgi:hypothetical protein